MSSGTIKSECILVIILICCVKIRVTSCSSFYPVCTPVCPRLLVHSNPQTVHLTSWYPQRCVTIDAGNRVVFDVNSWKELRRISVNSV